MALVRLNEDALLVRHAAASPELTSRVTGEAIPLDNEQTIVVMLLSEGPLEADEIVDRASRFHAVDLDWDALFAFIDELERLGLLERVDPTSPDGPQAWRGGQPLSPLPIAGAVDDGELDEEDTAVSSEFAEFGQGGAIIPPMEQQPARTPAPRERHTVRATPASRKSKPPKREERARDREAPMEPKPLLRLVPPVTSEEEPTRRLGASDLASLLPQPHPYPRLPAKWMPKLLPQSKNILLTCPAERSERELRSWEYQVARLMDGNRSPEQVVEWARSAGLRLRLEEVVAILEWLMHEGVLEPGTEPLVPPQPPPERRRRRPPTDELSQGPEPISDAFADLGDSPDSILESMELLQKPGYKRKSDVRREQRQRARRTPSPQSRPPARRSQPTPPTQPLIEPQAPIEPGPPQPSEPQQPRRHQPQARQQPPAGYPSEPDPYASSDPDSQPHPYAQPAQSPPHDHYAPGGAQYPYAPSDPRSQPQQPQVPSDPYAASDPRPQPQPYVPPDPAPHTQPQPPSQPQPPTQPQPPPHAQHPMAPQAQAPMEPQAQVPMAPQAQVPMAPQAQVPMAPQAQVPMEPQAQVPMEPQAQVPHAQVPMEPQAPAPRAPQAQAPQAQADPQAQAQTDLPTLPRQSEHEALYDALRQSVDLGEMEADEAEEAMKSLLTKDPEALKALALLDLVRGGSKAKPKSRLGLLIGLGVVGLVLIILLILGLAIKVESPVTLPCRVQLIPLGEVKSQLSGKVTAVSVKEGSVVRKKQMLARVSDEESKRRLAELKLKIDDKKELLRIMRTTGTVQDERKQKRIVVTLTARLKQLEQSCASGDDCQRKVAVATEGIASAKRKLKFCEWQAEPDEIQAEADGIAKMEQTLAKLSSKPLEISLVSSGAGMVTEIKIAEGMQVSRGAILAELVDAGRFQVEAFYTEKGEPIDVADVAATVRLLGEGGGTYPARPGATRRGGALLFEVPAEVSKVQTGAACHVEFIGGEFSLIRSWLK